MPAISTSIIVLTYNRPDALLKVLQGLAPQCGDGYEVVIADDGSTKSSIDFWRDRLPAFCCPVQHVWHPDNGFTASRARNLGAMVSQGKYLIFLDGDCIPGQRFVEAHAALAKCNCFVNGNRVLLSEKFTKHVLDDAVRLFHATWLDWLRWRLSGDVNKLTQLLYWPDAPLRMQKGFQWKKIRSCNFALWKDDFVKVNGFDETFEGWGHEDADLVLRLHNAGVCRRNGFLGTEVYHLWHKQFSRHAESVNYARVLERLNSGLVSAAKGIVDLRLDDGVVVTSLNSFLVKNSQQ